MMAGRYAHAKQFKWHHRELRILRTRLGRLIRDIRRKIAGREHLKAAFSGSLSRANQIGSQQQRQRGWKLYSFRAPEVEPGFRSEAQPLKKSGFERPFQARQSRLVMAS
jgi:IS5 family transposase